MSKSTTSVALYHLHQVETIKQVEGKLKKIGMKLARVDEDWIWRQCFSMERTHVLALNDKGEPKIFFFAWGRIFEWEPEIRENPLIVAVEVPQGPLPPGAWRYEPIDRAVSIIQFLGGDPVTRLVTGSKMPRLEMRTVLKC